MSRTLKWIIGLAAVAFVAVMIRSSFEQSQYRYQVCVNFHGRSNCSTAQGRTPGEAIRSAKNEDCTLLVGSRAVEPAALRACEDTEPASIQRVSGSYQTPAGMR